MGDEHCSAPHERDRKCYVFRLAMLYGQTPLLRMAQKNTLKVFHSCHFTPYASLLTPHNFFDCSEVGLTVLAICH